MQLSELIQKTYESRWAGTKSEDTAIRIAKGIEEHFGAHCGVSKIPTHAVENWRATLKRQGLKPGTINRRLAVLSTILNYGYTIGALDHVPGIRREKAEPGRTYVLDQDTEKELFDWLWDHDHDRIQNLCEFLVDTGLRVSEALSLQWEDLTENQTTVLVRKSKGGRPRSIPLTERARTAIHYAHESHLTGPFADITSSQLNHAFRAARQAVGIENPECVPHALRHTCATRLVQAGVDLLTVKEWLGHSDIQMTLKYTHLASRQLTKARDLLETFEE